ncbi:MAG: thiamine pyrophosphate-dependent enzyme [Acidimicrobiales bacterium]
MSLGDVRTGGDALAAQLRAEGVEVIFGLPGDQLMAALDALVDVPEIRFVVTRHEQATTYMADGYARAAGRPGVALVVPGVGVYNACSGLATAYACSSPVLLLAGQVNRHGIGKDLGLLHDVHDQLEVVRPVTTSAERALDGNAIPGAVHRAFVEMATGRPRPTEVEFPPEALLEPADAAPVDPVAVPPVAPDQAEVAKAAALLAGAASPLVVAGGGVVLGGGTEALRAVAERLQAPIVTTREGKGAVDHRHPLSVGTLWASQRLGPVVAQADVVLAVGTRFQGFRLAPHQRLVHLDVDAAEIGRNHPADVGVVGDGRLSLERLDEALAADGVGSRPSRATEVAAWRAEFEDGLRAVGPQARMVELLRQGVPEDGIVVCDTTSVAYMCHMYYPVYEPRTYFSTSYMGTLGFAYPAALGVKVARPDRPVVTVVGDGGFLYAATELATALQHGIDTVTVVFDDGAYGNSNRDQREKYGGRELGTLLENPDWAALAGAFGARGVTLDDVEQLPRAIAEAIDAGTSSVIAVPMGRLPSPF